MCPEAGLGAGSRDLERLRTEQRRLRAEGPHAARDVTPSYVPRQAVSPSTLFFGALARSSALPVLAEGSQKGRAWVACLGVFWLLYPAAVALHWAAVRRSYAQQRERLAQYEAHASRVYEVTCAAIEASIGELQRQLAGDQAGTAKGEGG